MDMWVKRSRKETSRNCSGTPKQDEGNEKEAVKPEGKRRRQDGEGGDDVELALDIDHLPWVTVGPKGKKIITIGRSGFVGQGR